jgi:hypothetical protein
MLMDYCGSVITVTINYTMCILNSTIEKISCLILSISTIQSTYALVIPVALWWRLIQDLLHKNKFFLVFSAVHSIYSFLKKEGIGCHSIGARDYNSKRTPCSGKWRSSSRSFFNKLFFDLILEGGFKWVTTILKPFNAFLPLSSG